MLFGLTERFFFIIALGYANTRAPTAVFATVGKTKGSICALHAFACKYHWWIAKTVSGFCEGG
ncbi:hypothetical protein VCR9J2_1070003 [Vibrio crassostreae]|nr:hypothetical protein VCR9J2_1070003 [Vibrio crassostreae]